MVIFTYLIIVTIQYDNNNFLKYIHKEGIPKYQDIPMNCYEIINNLDKEINDKIDQKIVNNTKDLEEKIEIEYKKMIEILKKIGYKIFLTGEWE